VRCRARGGRVDLADLLDKLAQRGVTHLLVEGGGEVATSFLAAGLVDRLLLFLSPRIVGGDGLAWARAPGPRRLADALRLAEVEVTRHGDDVLVSGIPQMAVSPGRG
jgi:diaminohydroxyphosphoribosylaminopyrimidine deaminase/5-amino-6-(5-phosphoribosylamino)uracil reductase